MGEDCGRPSGPIWGGWQCGGKVVGDHLAPFKVDGTVGGELCRTICAPRVGGTMGVVWAPLWDGGRAAWNPKY